MRRLFPLLTLLIFISLSGCKPAGKAYSSLQYHNINLRLVKSTMCMYIGEGKIDARQLMEKETYYGNVHRGRVDVEYPQGLEQTAEKLSTEFNDFYPIVQKELGVDWGFDLTIKLVRVENNASGYRYSTTIPKNRRITFPVLVAQDGPNNEWTPVIVHELTEASMIAPKKRSGLVLADLYNDSFCYSTGARWFRDGVADFASHLFEINITDGSYQMPEALYVSLNQTREQLLSWSNCPDAPWLYDAAAGLILEIRNRYGNDAVARIFDELSKESVPGGRGLKHAFKRATGDDLETFLKNYQTPWTGMITRDTSPSESLPYSVKPDNRVLVSHVYDATPAKRRGIETGDIVLCVDGKPIKSSDQIAQVLSTHKPWEMISIEIERAGQRMPMKLKLIPRPADINQFLELSKGIQHQ